MKEKRQYERFILPLPVRLETIELGRKKVLDLNTRDLSASGTFIITLTSFPEETRFVLDFTIPINSIKRLKEAWCVQPPTVSRFTLTENVRLRV